MLSAKEKREISKQLNAMTGQIKAIQDMIENNRETRDIYIQFKAVEGIMNKALYTVLDNLFRKKLASTIVKVIDDCYDEECPHCKQVGEIKDQFSEMAMRDVIKYLDELENCLR
ncbi:hypothetical protein MNBD_IGNAVI01-170 [hydrothermal vent metagenome]|uniref:Uncharacterized protein n=1 Tax=hydrothermal vent metagenome TaxID=652676 RepID=A0A3B1D377_9ZZZZ